MKPWRPLIVMMTVLSRPGCGYTDTDLGFQAGGSANPIPEGYWKVCGIFAGRMEECHILRNERAVVGGGVFYGTAGVVSVYAVRPLKDDHFVYQTHFKASLTEAFFYALGRTEKDGSVSLSSPDCRFPRKIVDEISAVGLSFPLPIPFLPRSCAVRNASSDSILMEFTILSKHRDWQSDASRKLVPMSDAEGAEAFEAERKGDGAGGGRRTQQDRCGRAGSEPDGAGRRFEVLPLVVVMEDRPICPGPAPASRKRRCDDRSCSVGSL